jgi:hypothetical protein
MATVAGVPNPVTTIQSATGASYTVPSGSVAVAKVFVSGGGKFSVNGVEVLVSPSWTVINSNFSPQTTASAQMQVQTSLGAGVSNTFANSTATSTIAQVFVLKTGDVILGTPGAGKAAYHIEVYPA